VWTREFYLFFPLFHKDAFLHNCRSRPLALFSVQFLSPSLQGVLAYAPAAFIFERRTVHYRIAAYTAFASRNFSITKVFSSAEFQFGYFSVTSIVRSIQAWKYCESSLEKARLPPIVT
jgi:hypothetical protein